MIHLVAHLILVLSRIAHEELLGSTVAEFLVHTLPGRVGILRAPDELIQHILSILGGDTHLRKRKQILILSRHSAGSDFNVLNGTEAVEPSLGLLGVLIVMLCSPQIVIHVFTNHSGDVGADTLSPGLVLLT